MSVITYPITREDIFLVRPGELVEFREFYNDFRIYDHRGFPGGAQANGLCVCVLPRIRYGSQDDEMCVLYKGMVWYTKLRYLKPFGVKETFFGD